MINKNYINFISSNPDLNSFKNNSESSINRSNSKRNRNNSNRNNRNRNNSKKKPKIIPYKYKNPVKFLGIIDGKPKFSGKSVTNPKSTLYFNFEENDNNCVNAVLDIRKNKHKSGNYESISEKFVPHHYYKNKKLNEISPGTIVGQLVEL